jgi:hypothetical protein
MANPFLGVRIPPALEAALIDRMHETGQSKSDIVIQALRCYLGMMPCHERLGAIEERLSALEAMAQEAQTWMHTSHAHMSQSTHSHPSVDPSHPSHH